MSDSIKIDNCVTDDCISPEDADIIAKKILKESFSKVVKYYFDSTSTEQLGFMGQHRELKIIVQKNNNTNHETLNLFVKSIPYNIRNESDSAAMEKIYLKETTLLNIIKHKLMENCNGEKWSPICYLAKKDMLVMEDLRYQGYKLVGRIFDETTVIKSALTTLARFHSCSILAEAQLNLQSEVPIKLNDYYADALREGSISRTGKSAEWISSSFDLVAVLASRLGHDKDKLKIAFDQIYDIVKPSQKHRNVICHADLWSNNLMFDNTKPIPKCVLVDFQLIRYAPLVLDILHFLYLNTSRSYRKVSEAALIEFYHSVLKETITINDTTKTVEIPTLEELTNAFEDLRLYGALIGTLCLPLALLDPKISEECTKDANDYENFIYGDRQQIILAYMEKDKFFKKTIEEIITELAEISERL